jgi:hypothetical protein
MSDSVKYPFVKNFDYYLVTLRLNDLIEELIKMRDSNPDAGLKPVYWDEDRMNGDLDFHPVRKPFDDGKYIII